MASFGRGQHNEYLSGPLPATLLTRCFEASIVELKRILLRGEHYLPGLTQWCYTRAVAGLMQGPERRRRRQGLADDASHVTGIQLTPETRVRSALDEVAINICQAVDGGPAPQTSLGGRRQFFG
jgi:hypothetical protein